MVTGTTTITAPYTRLLRKLDREGVMELPLSAVGRADPKDSTQVSTMAPPMR